MSLWESTGDSQETRFLAGWTLGPKDAAKKVSPYLVPLDELPKEIKKYDVEAVRDIPTLLEMIHHRVYREMPRTQ